MLKKIYLTNNRIKLERAFQRAMNIRDSTSFVGNLKELNKQETDYLNTYLIAWKSGKIGNFSANTRKYLKYLREHSKKEKQCNQKRQY